MRFHESSTLLFDARKMLTIIILLLSTCNLVWSKPRPESGPSVNLAPGPFGSLDNLSPPPSDSEKVFIPPDIKYWAYGKLNTTVLDAGIYVHNELPHFYVKS